MMTPLCARIGANTKKRQNIARTGACGLPDLMCATDDGKGTPPRKPPVRINSTSRHKGRRLVSTGSLSQGDWSAPLIVSIDIRSAFAGGAQFIIARREGPSLECYFRSDLGQRRTCERKLRDRRHQAQGHRQFRRSPEHVPSAKSTHAAFEEADSKADEFSLRAQRGADRSTGQRQKRRNISLDLVPRTDSAGKDWPATGWQARHELASA